MELAMAGRVHPADRGRPEAPPLGGRARAHITVPELPLPIGLRCLFARVEAVGLTTRAALGGAAPASREGVCGRRPMQAAGR